MVISNEAEPFIGPEEVFNPKCDDLVREMAYRQISTIYVSEWPEHELPTRNFKHLLVEGVKLLIEGEDLHELASIETSSMETAIKKFVSDHPDCGIRVDEYHPRVVAFERSAEASQEQKQLRSDCRDLMEKLVEGRKEFFVGVHNEAIAILRNKNTQFDEVIKVLGWDSKVFLLITNDEGDQSLKERANVVIVVNGENDRDREGLAEILDWITSLHPRI